MMTIWFTLTTNKQDNSRIYIHNESRGEQEQKEGDQKGGCCEVTVRDDGLCWNVTDEDRRESECLR